MEFNKILKNIKIYEAGKPIELVVREFGIKKEDIIKLASNENPNGCSPLVVDAIKSVANEVNLYPDDSFYQLKEGLADRFNLKSENFIIGAGSDQVIEFAIRAKANEKNGILIAKTTFAMYEIYARQIGAKIFKTPSDTHNLEEFLEIYQKNREEIGIIFLCLPNNPLGETLKREEVYNFIKKIDKNTLIVVDGAYQEYAKYKDREREIKPKELIETFSNTLYLGTFSKAYGVGGMRVGYGISNSEIVSTLHKLRPPFNITTLSLVAGVTALKDTQFVENSIKENFLEMKRYEEFAKKRGFEYIESYTNFITIKLGDINSKEIFDKLFRRGIIIRDLSSYQLNAIRITIGKPYQNDRFFEEIEKILVR